jgi:diketogulonate reductase-like aldo/keto reductase
MHCQDIINPLATWRESWRALEKAYAEGYLQSIGVSNFDLNLLKELEEQIGVILPHIVQNWSDFSNLDLPVRQWCNEREVTYQPYASNRNLDRLPADIKEKVLLIANDRQVTPQFLSNQFFLQTGAVIIPRSTDLDHLKDNLKVADWSLEPDEFEMLGWTL